MEDYIKRKGFTPPKALLVGAGALFLAATIANTALSMKGVDTGIGAKATLTCLWLGLIMAIVATILSNFFRRAIWNNKGYSGTPVPLFMWLKADGSTTLTKDFLLNYESLLPRELLEEICVQEGTIAGSEVVTEVCAVEKTVSSFTSMFLTIVAVVLLFAGVPEYSAAAIFAMCLCAIFRRTRSKTFHGSDVASKYYQEGLGVYYVLQQALAMNIPAGNLVEEFSDLEMEYFQDSTFIYYSLVDWQGLFLQKSLSSDGSPALDSATMSFCKKERMRSFKYREPSITRYRLNLNDIYMCYVLIHGTDADRRDLVKEYYKKLTVGDNSKANTLRQELDWRKDLVSGKHVDVKAYPFFRPIEYLKYFPQYTKNAEEVQAKALAKVPSSPSSEDVE